jgi:hypothetical protein
LLSIKFLPNAIWCRNYITLLKTMRGSRLRSICCVTKKKLVTENEKKQIE